MSEAEQISVTYNQSGEPDSVDVTFGISGDVDDGVVTIDPDECLWVMYSDESQERMKEALLSVPRINEVNVLEYTGDSDD